MRAELSRIGRGFNGMSNVHLPLPQRGPRCRQDGPDGPVGHPAIRDFRAAQRRGYASSGAGTTTLDDPVPEYSPRLPSIPRERGGACPDGETPPVVMEERRHDVIPDDSVSQLNNDTLSPVPRLSTRSVSTRSTVSLSDSSVERVADRLAACSLRDPGHRRRAAAVVSDDAATSARRPKHRSRSATRAEKLNLAGQLMFGGADVRCRKNDTVVIKKKPRLPTIGE